MKFLSKVVKNDPKDRLEIELGDTKEPSVFFPQLKIKRWDNEVNASFRLKDFDNFSISSDKGKIKLVNGKKEVHLYPIEPCEEHPEGGFEFEVILKEKPASNVLEFSIETKELDFLYQPALTQEEIDKGANRPENVVGSYAVYHKTKGGLNVAGGKKYKVGKAFHIFRPKIIDAEGNWAWGELHIDVENKLQTITIPQEFLDNAVYPIRHAAGETFGYTTVGSSSGATSADRMFMASDTAPDGTLDSVSIYGDAVSTSIDAAYVIYKYSDKSLVHNGADNNNVDWTSTDWHTLIAADEILSSLDSAYYVGVGYNDVGSSETFYWDTGFPEQSGGYAALAWISRFPDPFSWAVAPGQTNRKISVYATYTPAGAGARRYYSPGIWRTV